MDDLEEKHRPAPPLPFDAAALRSWMVAELLPGLEGVPFQDRLDLFAAVIDLARELKILEQYAFLAAYDAKDTGRTLKLLAGPISRKSLERAAASRAETLHRRFPGGSREMAEAIKERAARKAQAEEAAAENALPEDP